MSEPKFKIGDRVKWEGTINKVSSNGCWGLVFGRYDLDLDGDGAWLRFDELTIVRRAPKPRRKRKGGRK